jgi:hypothetical protein
MGQIESGLLKFSACNSTSGKATAVMYAPLETCFPGTYYQNGNIATYQIWLLEDMDEFTVLHNQYDYPTLADCEYDYYNLQLGSNAAYSYDE